MSSLAVLLVAVTMATVTCATRGPSKLDSTDQPDPEETVTISTACGEYLNPPRFVGTVLRRSADGGLLPLSGVRFFRAIGEDELKGPHVWPTDFTTDAAARFDAVVGIRASSTTWKEAGRFIKSEGWVEDVVFELRANGCDSVVVHFSMQWEPQSIVMSCRESDTKTWHDS